MKEVLALMVVATFVLPVAAPAPAQECLEAPDDLVSWWSGDVDASDIEDGNHGVPTNGATLAPGYVGNAFSLDGFDDMIVVPDSAGVRPSGAFTIAAWVNFAGTDGTLYGGAADVGQGLQYVVFKRNSRLTEFQAYGLAKRAGTFRFLAQAGDGRVIFFNVSNTPVGPQHWYHVVGTYDSAAAPPAAKLYVNGALEVHEANIPATGAALDHSEQPLVIGRTSQDGEPGEANFDAAFFGLIDEVMLFDRALAAAEVQALYAAGTAGACKDEDGDGFRPPRDCDESSAAINPSALELPGNLTDENCDGDLGTCSPCAAWRNHGEYVRCVAQAVEGLVLGGALTEEEGDRLVTSAAQSEVGKKGFVPLGCAP